MPAQRSAHSPREVSREWFGSYHQSPHHQHLQPWHAPHRARPHWALREAALAYPVRGRHGLPAMRFADTARGDTMSGQFKVGEVLVGQNHIFDTSLNGMECTVVEGLEMRTSFATGVGLEEGMAYVVEWADGRVWDCDPRNLRRKQPPTGEESILRMFTAPAPREVEAV